MTTAREVMTGGAECASVNETVSDAARKMKDLGVGALPICGDDNRLAGMITDRDIVLKCVAEGMDTSQVRVQDRRRRQTGAGVVEVHDAGAPWRLRAQARDLLGRPADAHPIILPASALRPA